mmetsp:Transcript_14427/g.41469  ORF Transcript_14427/g.41469 Transcript_14427/m.41469 type:complete len:110 (-) Transcript_14427:119-448(-)
MIQARLFQDALVKLQGGDHEGNEDVAREMVKLAVHSKEANGGRLLLTNAITEEAISNAEGGDLAEARENLISLKRHCSVTGCTSQKKKGGMCGKHLKEKEKEKSANADV